MSTSKPSARMAAIVAASLCWLAAGSSPGLASLPPGALAQGAGPGPAVITDDVLIKPHGWLEYDSACILGSSLTTGFATRIDRAKRRTGRVIVREFRGIQGNPYRRALPAMLGLDCVPFSVGFD